MARPGPMAFSRDGSGHGWRVSVFQAQISLPRKMPDTARVYHEPLAWPTPRTRSFSDWPNARRLLRRLLLGADADNVFRRNRKRRMDAGPRVGDGGREESLVEASS